MNEPAILSVESFLKHSVILCFCLFRWVHHPLLLILLEVRGFWGLRTLNSSSDWTCWRVFACLFLGKHGKAYLPKKEHFWKFVCLFSVCSVIRGSDWDPHRSAYAQAHAVSGKLFVKPNSVKKTIFSSCQSGDLAQVRLLVRLLVLLWSGSGPAPGPAPGSQSGALPAVCCAPLVEEVLIYCLHDLVKYITWMIMN